MEKKIEFEEIYYDSYSTLFMGQEVIARVPVKCGDTATERGEILAWEIEDRWNAYQRQFGKRIYLVVGSVLVLYAGVNTEVRIVSSELSPEELRENLNREETRPGWNYEVTEYIWKGGNLVPVKVDDNE